MGCRCVARVATRAAAIYVFPGRGPCSGHAGLRPADPGGPSHRPPAPRHHSCTDRLLDGWRCSGQQCTDKNSARPPRSPSDPKQDRLAVRNLRGNVARGLTGLQAVVGAAQGELEGAHMLGGQVQKNGQNVHELLVVLLVDEGPDGHCVLGLEHVGVRAARPPRPIIWLSPKVTPAALGMLCTSLLCANLCSVHIFTVCT